MRLFWLAGALMLALGLAVLTLQSPRPAPADAPATAFSAGRAMIDVREMARRPHPVGSPDHARVQALLAGRMRALGLQTTTQTGPLSPSAIRYLTQMGGDPAAAAFSATNLIGVLPGRDPALPAVLLMAHYDTVPGSPGAADDSTGVASALEAARAIRARGPAARTLIVLLTDSEELGLDGARIFFGGHPLRDRVGAVVNMEARGGGGRAIMFETGRGNAATIDLFARSAVRAPGGVTSNSLAVLVYEMMPNDTDFTIPKARGVPGINLAFIGRPAQYHSPASTAAALDPGSVQHIGGQTLEMTDALLRAPTLPAKTRNRVYSDLFGRMILGHPPVAGWGLLALAAALAGAAGWRAGRRAGLSWADAGRGAVDGVWFVAAGVVLAQTTRLLAGPLVGRGTSPETYYTLLGRLPWMEAGVALVVLALALTVIAGRGRLDRRWMAGGLAAAALVALGLGGLNPLVIGAAVAAIGLALFPALSPRTTWGGWLGLIGLVLILGLAVQVMAPEAAFLLIWPGVLAALAAAVAAFADPALLKPASLGPAAGIAVMGVAWLAGMAHAVFLGVGMDLPAVLVLIGVVAVMFVRPLSPERAGVRLVLAAALGALVLGCGLSFAARFVEPAPVAAVQG